MPEETLADAFYGELRDILDAERQLVDALEKLAENASSEDLQQAFQMHLEETKIQIERVQQAFEETGKAARAKTCKGMKGLIKESDEILKKKEPGPVRDALLIGAAQKAEHYEIAAYGTLCTWARMLGYDSALDLLKQNIAEEEETDEKLSKLAETVNQEAAAAVQ